MVSLHYATRKEDYINYYTYVMWDAPENKGKRIRYYSRQIVPIVLFIVAFYYTGIFERSSKFILLILGFIFLTSLLSLLGVRSNTLRQAEKVAEDPNNSSIFLETILVASDAGVAVKDEIQETKYSWKAFIKKQESNEYYFLFVSSLQALIIPKRAFVNAEQQSQFEKLLSQYLSFDADIGHLVKS